MDRIYHARTRERVSPGSRKFAGLCATKKVVDFVFCKNYNGKSGGGIIYLPLYCERPMWNMCDRREALGCTRVFETQNQQEIQLLVCPSLYQQIGVF